MTFWRCTQGKKRSRDKGAPNLGESGPRQPRPQGALRLGPRKFFLNLGCRKCHPAFSAGHSQSIKTKGNAVISCSLYPISGVIVKVQCLRQKRAKQWSHQGGYKQRARCVPFKRANSVPMPSLSITSLFPVVYVQNCNMQLSLSSVMVLRKGVYSLFIPLNYTQPCMLTQDNVSQQSYESYILTPG